MKYFYYTITFVFFVLFTGMAVANSPYIVGYGYSNYELSSERQELILQGFLEGFYLQPTTIPLIIKKDLSKKTLGAAKIAKELIKENANIIVGFPTTREALLVLNSVDTKNKYFLFAGAGHSDISEIGDNVFSLSVSVPNTLKRVINFIDKSSLSKGVVLYDSQSS